MKFGGKTFLHARQALEISERIPGNISGTLFLSSRLFFSESSFSRRAVLTLCKKNSG